MEWINYVYLGCLLLGVLNLIILSGLIKRQQCFYYVIFFMIIIVSGFGYLTMANAQFLKTALLGKTLTYFSAAYLPYVFLLSLSELCHLRIKKWASLCMLIYSSVVFSLVWSTMNGGTLFYATAELDTSRGITVLVTTSGPLHFLHECSVVFYVIATVGILVQAFIYQKNISYKYLWALAGLEIATFLVFLLEKLFVTPLEPMIFMYIFDEYVMMFLIYRIGKYEVSESIASTLYEEKNYAYMTFNRKLDYLGGSPTLKIFFPDIHNVRVDHPIDPLGNPVIEKAVDWLKTCVITGNSAPLYIQYGEKNLKCTWRTINNGFFGRVSGYLVELFDDTMQQKYMGLISNYNVQLEEEVSEKLRHIQEIQDQILIGVADIVESRDSNTGGHVKRTSHSIRIFMKQLEKESEVFHTNKRFCENIIKAAPMHDLGKIAVDDKILRKPARYTEAEYELMKVHAAVGADIVGKALTGVEDEAFLSVAKNIAKYHHERWDGTGYPEGLAGERIPLEARIMALADVFDALVSKRYYKEKYTYDKAFLIMEESMGNHFDPDLGAVFMKCRPELEAYYNSME